MSDLIHQTKHLLTSAQHRLTNLLRPGLDLLHAHRRPFLMLQAGYWSLTLLGGVLALRDPSRQLSAWNRVNADLDKYALGRWVSRAYAAGNVLLAAALTFGINLAVGSVLVITVPSIVPFAGVLVAGYRAGEWGLLFAPTVGAPGKLNLPHGITMLVEGQAYIIASLGGWLLAKAILSRVPGWVRQILSGASSSGPTLERLSGEGAVSYKAGEKEDGRGGAENRGATRTSWWEGVKGAVWDNVRLHGPIAAVLLVAAVWEAVEVIAWPMEPKGV